MNQVTEITVKGIGRVNALPDSIHVDLSVVARVKEYAATLATLNERVHAIAAVLSKVGIVEPAVTQSFDITEIWSDPYDAEKRKFQGFNGSHKLGVTFASDKAVLGQLVEELTTSSARPEMTISFILKDQSALKKIARIDAVRNAKEAASDLAEASGLVLTSVKSINFSTEQYDRLSSTSLDLDGRSMLQACMAPEIKPDEIRQEESVHMVWLASPKV